MKLSVIIPVYNEVTTIQELLKRVESVALDKEIIMVDDFSTDGTRDILKLAEKEKAGQDNHVFLYHEKNKGKGAAIRTAQQHVSGDIVIIQDADLEYDPSEYPNLISPIVNGDADVVYGSRFAGYPRRVLLFRHTLANHFLTFLSNLFTNINLTDMETCYKVFRADIFKIIPIRSNRFGFEPEITAKVSKIGCRIYEVPISYKGRTLEEGKKIGWKDGIIALWTIVKYGFFF
ncbi:MAG: glycosyltransferase family 2 protein [Deltaproteobacteria bacterium]|nr:glycosyltransferase family 2 protein [Deltaproteobacteria bacterium]MCL5791893.1 glycosyltransferase family 2 protein [Deltaproteobacteria bacterium]